MFADNFPNGIAVSTIERGRTSPMPETALVLRDGTVVRVEQHLNVDVATVEHKRWCERAAALKPGDKLWRIADGASMPEEVTVP